MITRTGYGVALDPMYVLKCYQSILASSTSTNQPGPEDTHEGNKSCSNTNQSLKGDKVDGSEDSKQRALLSKLLVKELSEFKDMDMNIDVEQLTDEQYLKLSSLAEKYLSNFLCRVFGSTAHEEQVWPVASRNDTERISQVYFEIYLDGKHKVHKETPEESQMKPKTKDLTSPLAWARYHCTHPKACMGLNIKVHPELLSHIHWYDSCHGQDEKGEKSENGEQTNGGKVLAMLAKRKTTQVIQECLEKREGRKNSPWSQAVEEFSKKKTNAGKK